MCYGYFCIIERCRSLPYSDASFKVQLFVGAENYGRSLQHVVVPKIIRLPLSTWRAKMRTNCGTPDAIHSESRSHPTNRPCCGRSIQAFVTENQPVQLSSTNPLKRAHLPTSTIIDTTFFFPGRCEALEQDALQPVQKNCSSCGSPRKRTIDLSIEDSSHSCCRTRHGRRVQV